MGMRFHLDEHINPAVADGLRRRGIDVTTTIEAGLGGAKDSAHIVFARSQQRVIVTEDTDFLALARSSVEHAGIVCCRSDRGVGSLIEFLITMDGCLTPEEMINHIEFC